MVAKNETSMMKLVRLPISRLLLPSVRFNESLKKLKDVYGLGGKPFHPGIHIIKSCAQATGLKFGDHFVTPYFYD